MKILFSLFMASSLFSVAQAKTKTFKMTYEVVTATAVCWQTCRHSGCEESTYEIFFDSKTFAKLSAVRNDDNTSWTLGGLRCDEDINIVDEHMPALQNNDPKAAAKILKEQGTEVELLVYTNINSQVKDFVQTTLEEARNTKGLSAKELLEKLGDAISSSDSLWNGSNETFQLEGSISKALKTYEKNFEERYGDKDLSEFSTNAGLSDDWLLGSCNDCLDAFDDLEASGEVANVIYWFNGSEDDSAEYHVVIILKDGTAMRIYFGN